MSEQERQDLELESIIKEFSDIPEEPVSQKESETEDTDALISLDDMESETLEIEEDVWEEAAQDAASQTENMQATRRMDPIREEQTNTEVTGDTIRLDGLREKITEHTKKEPVDAVRINEMEDTIRSEPFSERWEPEYEQPMGEYVPPQLIQFQPRSRLRELKRKLVAGPEKRFYQLSEKGVGKLQAAIFLSLLVVLISAASTAMYAFGMVREDRMRLMVFGQFLALLVSALLGSFQMIEGLMDLGKKRFTLNTMLAVTFVVCCVDGILCLRQLRVPCCAAFSLEVTMSLWSAYQRRSAEMAQMDTMRKAVYLDGVAVCPDYLDDKKGLLRTEGQVEDFMDHYAAPGKPEKLLDLFGMIAMFVALGIGVAAGVLKGSSAGVLQGLSTGVQVAAVSLLAAVPATGFISQSRPTWILEKRLHRLGTVLCGWRGVEALSGKAVFPITFQDLYPVEAVRMNGMKFFGSREPEQVMEYASAVITANGGGLADLFLQILDSHNGRHYDASDLCHYETGGVGGTVEGETVLIGSAGFLKEQNIDVPENVKLSYAVYVAIEGELSGLFAVSYEKTKTATAGLSTLNAYRKLYCALITNDFMLTHGFLHSKFGVKPRRFLLPEYETRALLREKKAEEGTPASLMATARGLAPLAYGVTGARALRTTCRLGAALHMIGGAMGLGIMILLVALGALDLLIPSNMFLYHLVWMIPGLLITEWTRSI